MEKSHFPFIYLHNGPLQPNMIDKAEELFILFSKIPSKKDQQRIKAHCPEPLNEFFSWFDRALHFGNASDSFQATLIRQYVTTEESKSLEKNYDWKLVYKILGRAAEDFPRKLEKWALEVHKIVPVVLFIGPLSGEGSEWDVWSKKQIKDHGVNYLEEYTKNNKKELTEATKKHKGFPEMAPFEIINFYKQFLEV